VDKGFNHWLGLTKVLSNPVQMITAKTEHQITNMHFFFSGHGVVAHKVIKDLCLLSGIKDIYVKTEGNTKNTITMTLAFFNAVTHQVQLLSKLLIIFHDVLVHLNVKIS
jgi:ribosomal protein S5